MYKRWFPFGILTGINRHSGVLNTQPLVKFLTDFFEEFGGKYHRKIAVSAVDMESGNYEVYNETNPEPIKAIISSAAIPFVFPNEKWADGTVVMDGGAVWNLNLVSAV
jgi:predicted acylesterase/phospholipase RssA